MFAYYLLPLSKNKNKTTIITTKELLSYIQAQFQSSWYVEIMRYQFSKLIPGPG